MDEKLLEEEMDFLQPYLLKWHREYIAMMLSSSYKTLKYEIKDEILAPSNDMLCQSYLNSISEAFRELVRTYFYSEAAYIIESDLKVKDKIGRSNYWKYEVKNYYFRTVIPRIISLLDYVAVMINELSQCKIEKDDKKVYFHSFRSKLKKRKEKAGWLTLDVIEELDDILLCVDKDIRQEDMKILKHFRDTTTHRYFVGIDELTVPFQRRKLSKQDEDRLGTHYNQVYGMSGRPEYTFDELKNTALKLIKNLDDMLSKLMQMDMMRNSVQKRDE